jgi:hypothetical protein
MENTGLFTSKISETMDFKFYEEVELKTLFGSSVDLLRCIQDCDNLFYLFSINWLLHYIG